MSARSLSFFRPANAILFPGMNFLGFRRYWSRTSAVQVTPDSLFAFEYANPGTVPEVRPTIPYRLGPTPLAAPCVLWCEGGVAMLKETWIMSKFVNCASVSRNEDWWKTVPKRKGTSVAPVLSRGKKKRRQRNGIRLEPENTKAFNS